MTVFSMQIYRYPEVWYNHHIAAVFETSALKEVSIFMLSKVAYMCHQKMHFFVSFLHETFPVLLPIATYTRSYHL